MEHSSANASPETVGADVMSEEAVQGPESGAPHIGVPRRAWTWFASGRFGLGLQVLVVSAILAAIVFGFQGDAGISQGAIWLTFGLFAMSVGLIWGYCGIMSFGQATFFGLGAYAYAWSTTDKLGLDAGSLGPLLGLIAAIILPGLFAMLLAYFLFYGKVVGAFFSIVMLAVSFLMASLGMGWSAVFGGSMGISGVPGLSIFGLSGTGIYAGYVIITIVVALVAVLLQTVLKTSFGLMIAGVSDNEDRFVMLGSKTVLTKLIVFSLSSAVAGLAGALYASEANFVSADLMGTLLSTEAVVWVAVGGRSKLIGALIGALIVRAAGYWLSDVAVNYWLILLGSLFIIIVLAGSTGLVGLVTWLWGRVARRVAADR
jgi:urea transport system permease protein